jgi:hypothetical protein
MIVVAWIQTFSCALSCLSALLNVWCFRALDPVWMIWRDNPCPAIMFDSLVGERRSQGATMALWITMLVWVVEILTSWHEGGCCIAFYRRSFEVVESANSLGVAVLGSWEIGLLPRTNVIPSGSKIRGSWSLIISGTIPMLLAKGSRGVIASCVRSDACRCWNVVIVDNVGLSGYQGINSFSRPVIISNKTSTLIAARRADVVKRRDRRAMTWTQCRRDVVLSGLLVCTVDLIL